jgi:rhodanese-related sulfurtransferase
MMRSSLTALVICFITGIAFCQSDEYVCMPCGLECDQKVYDKPGKCSSCMMELVKKSNVVFSNVQPEDLCDFIQRHPGIVLLDVRTQKEFEERSTPNYGTLKNAINIPIQELDKRLDELSHYKNKDVLIYCSHSQRSSRASYLLTQNGFHHVFNMAGGMSVLKDDSCKK